MKHQQYIKIIFLSLGFISSFAYGQKMSMYNMDEVRDVSSLELEVLRDWHSVATTPATQQKIVEITLCDFENGRKVRIPVTYVVPDANQACNFIVSSGNLGPTVYKEFDDLKTKMLENGVGFVLPALGPIRKMKPAGPQLDAEMQQLFKKTSNMKYTSPWLWGATYMRATTAALSETEHFLDEKIACDGRSKSGLASAIAMIHYPEVTGLYARVWPSATFPEYFSKAYKEKVEQDNKTFYQQLAAGEIANLGTIDDDANAEMRKRAEQMVAKEKYPKYSNRSTKELRSMILVTENLDVLEKKGAQYYFFVGTNDNLTMDVPLLAERYPDHPITYYPGGRHGGKPSLLGVSVTPDSEEAKASRIAFFSEFYLGENAVMEKPDLQYAYQSEGRTISVTVSFSEDAPEKVALHYAFDRFAAGSVGYEYDVWEQQAMKKKNDRLWKLDVTVPDHVKTVSMLSFQEGDKYVKSYSSSNYITVLTD